MNRDGQSMSPAAMAAFDFLFGDVNQNPFEIGTEDWKIYNQHWQGLKREHDAIKLEMPGEHTKTSE